MSQTTLEERVSALERTGREIVQSPRLAGQVKDWRRTMGMFTGDELMKEIDAAEATFVAQDRKRGGKRRSGVVLEDDPVRH